MIESIAKHLFPSSFPGLRTGDGAVDETDVTLFILSDHGMAVAGGHGGTTNEEVGTVLSIVSSADYLHLMPSGIPTFAAPTKTLTLESSEDTLPGASVTTERKEFPLLLQVDLSVILGYSLASRTQSSSIPFHHAVELLPPRLLGLVPPILWNFVLKSNSAKTLQWFLLAAETKRLLRIAEEQQLQPALSTLRDLTKQEVIGSLSFAEWFQRLFKARQLLLKATGSVDPVQVQGPCDTAGGHSRRSWHLRALFPLRPRSLKGKNE